MSVYPAPPVWPALSKAALVVAHPDDETLWAGGLVLEHSAWDWFIGTLCRASDQDRAPRFGRVLQRLHAHGAMRDVDDGPEQVPLPAAVVEQQVLALLPPTHFGLVVTHGPRGEYTWHQRHVEVCRAIRALGRAGRISTRALWLFAFEDGGGQHLPQAVLEAHLYQTLTPPIWQAKYDLITQTYGFQPESWEARVTPRAEAFWCFQSPAQLDQWWDQAGVEA